ncbi:von Willebrand factor A domain-containing protein 3B [Varanus komodoensis]|nr:von Willebrand factor A domain-containing protein 3B [Varanus komodoensis]
MKPLGEVIRRCGLWNHQYADDTQHYLSFSTNPGEAVAVLNQCLAEVMGWMRANKLKLNPDKMEVLLVGGSGFGEGELNLVLNGVALPLRDKVRSLGVLLDPELSLEAQVTVVVRSSFYQLRPYLENDCLATVTHALVTSCLDFCNALYVGLPLKTVRILQLVQNRATRLLMGTGRYVHMTPVLHQLHWLPIEVWAQFKVLVMTYKALNGLRPGYLKEHLRPYMPARPLRSVGEALLREPSVKDIRREFFMGLELHRAKGGFGYYDNVDSGGQDLVKWQEKAVPVTEDSIDAAIEWLWMMDHMPAVCHMGPTEALLEALSDDTTEAVYYFAVGDMPECMKHLLMEKISRSPCPIHTVSFNAREEETVTILKELSQLTTGRFHAFVERTDYTDMVPTSVSSEDQRNLTTCSSRKLKGGLPLGTGVREDVFLIWKELEEAKNTLIHIQRILIEFGESDLVTATKASCSPCESKAKDYINSKEWLQKNGLKAQKLTISKAFGDCAFRHMDGIVDIKTKPDDESLQTDAVTNKKIIGAKYCDKFMHTFLEDGSIVHIHLNDERCMQYADRMRNALDQMEKRLQEVKQGSRALFGEIAEDHIYILVDTSHSMKDKLPVVKEKLFQLIQEQLQNKTKFNLIKFDADVVAWKEQLANVNKQNLENALLWVKELQVGSSTNTLKALQLAFSDSNTQAIYLLTDGRPDQPPNTILAQLELKRNIPVHTISFNCDDTRANKFLHELASETGGRFHYYHIRLRDPDAPKPFEASLDCLKL